MKFKCTCQEIVQFVRRTIVFERGYSDTTDICIFQARHVETHKSRRFRASYDDELSHLKTQMASQKKAVAFTLILGVSAQLCVDNGYKVVPNGVEFRASTVAPSAKPWQHQHKAKAEAKLAIKSALEGLAEEYYIKPEERGPRVPDVINPKMRIEAASYFKESVNASSEVIDSRGFLFTALSAFDQHINLALRPDDIWALISYGFARHVDEHAEELRKNFVGHEGKKGLLVKVNHFVMGETPAELWERDVFADFSKQIRKHIGEKVHGAIAA
eukprot:1320698-Amorphochlora_amoeboformis.AAC.1